MVAWRWRYSEWDGTQERFLGDNAAAAAKFLQRQYRKGYELPRV